MKNQIYLRVCARGSPRSAIVKCSISPAASTDPQKGRLKTASTCRSEAGSVSGVQPLRQWFFLYSSSTESYSASEYCGGDFPTRRITRG